MTESPAPGVNKCPSSSAPLPSKTATTTTTGPEQQKASSPSGQAVGTSAGLAVCLPMCSGQQCNLVSSCRLKL
jgi:hypothetical protein